MNATVDEQLARLAGSIVHEGLADEVLAFAPLFDALALVPASIDVVDDLRARFTAALGDDAAHALTDGATASEIARRGERLLAIVAAMTALA